MIGCCSVRAPWHPILVAAQWAISMPGGDSGAHTNRRQHVRVLNGRMLSLIDVCTAVDAGHPDDRQRRD